MSEVGCTRGDTLEVAAGPHDRDDALVTVPCQGCACEGAHLLEEVEGSGQVTAQWQAKTGTLSFLLPHLPAGATRRYRIAGETIEPEGVAIQAQAEQMDFSVRGEAFTSYRFAADLARPCCYPVLGPGGRQVTNYAPSDHPHHKSLYVAQGSVNGHDNWSEVEGHARTVNRECRITAQGPVYGELVASNVWETAHGEPLLDELSSIRVFNLPGENRLLEWRIELHASHRGVFIGDTKEAGIMSVRVAASMEVPHGGRIVNAYGTVGEGECWGQPAPWVDYSGPVEESTLGIAILDHPTNFRYPTPWHVRDYGLFTANCWGLHDFSGDWAVRGDHALSAGQSLRWTFRVYIHEGDEAEARVREQWLNFAHPPTVTILET